MNGAYEQNPLVDEMLANAAERLAERDFDGARAALAQATELAGEDHPEVLFGQACILWEERGSEHARPLLERLVAADDTHADAHHALGCAAEERDDAARAIEHFLRVHKLDARSDRDARLGSQAEFDHIERTAREVLEALPSPFVERLAHVPVVLERRPSRALVEDGFDPRALGLFDGAIDGDHDSPTPTRIVLFVNNLLAEFPEEPELDEQIEITLLHEIGHFFGLDEDDMERLGLE